MASVLRFDEWQDSDGNPVLDGTGLAIPTSALPAGSILQIDSDTLTTNISTSVTAGSISSDISGFVASFTPTSATSKVFVQVNMFVALEVAPVFIHVYLYRNGTQIGQGDAASNRQRANGSTLYNNTGSSTPISFSFLDSPATTSTTSYSVRLGHSSGSTRTLYVNRGADDTDTIYTSRQSSTITIMEVAA